MLKLLETLKDSAESTVDSAASRVENVHRLISGYVGSQARRLRGRSRADAPPNVDSPAQNADSTIYDVLRGVNREIGEFGTDVFEIIDDARARRAVDKEGDPDKRD
ncbi:hypothetical protein J7355_06515 [Endozoicomonas sp. G2_2]|uniref:hypothetical protein n=1 Tax=Endozoicomonas sp. G2_2 TaxID=2821092 RepID=UPI001ADB25B1|nr:hypothetical protein [Endozoicomonas sp. G2_2]MBO9469747.1 hypothetical protein [Endozoicomonas sp. G2_2]